MMVISTWCSTRKRLKVFASPMLLVLVHATLKPTLQNKQKHTHTHAKYMRACKNGLSSSCTSTYVYIYIRIDVDVYVYIIYIYIYINKYTHTDKCLRAWSIAHVHAELGSVSAFVFQTCAYEFCRHEDLNFAKARRHRLRETEWRPVPASQLVNVE